MITGEVFPGEDAEILVEAIKNDYSGEDIDGITNPVVYVKHYKEDPVQAVGATAVYNPTMGQVLVTIPSAYVPASGTFDFVLKGDDIADVLGRIQVNTCDASLAAIKAITDLLTADPLAAINAQCDNALSDYDAPTKAEMDSAFSTTNGLVSAVASTGTEHVIPPANYTLDAEAKTISLASPYNTLTVEQIKFIKDLTANYIIYDDRETSYDDLPISITNGVITYTAPAQNTVAGNVIQISINM